MRTVRSGPADATVGLRRRRVRARVAGVVQGVGFRPYVFGNATSLGLDGWVLNDSLGVLVEVEGGDAAVQRFLQTLADGVPPLASVENVSVEEIGTTGVAGFSIRASERSATAEAHVAADAATCEACLRELWDPADRRFRYPFINCTDCGPRFTIVAGVPYDRPLTTMVGFVMCAACQGEYDDPLDRRFHAQPNACPMCGPAVELRDREGPLLPSPHPDAVAAAAAALGAGEIVAVKGLGGFHLACRADDAEAVVRLRERKHREDRPFALMVADLKAARDLVSLGPVGERLLLGRERPIVLAGRRPDARIAEAVAPGHRDLGVMLPYTPLHHLLLNDVRVPLVMTSGNVSDEPIAYRDDEARERLAPIADLFLLHDRPIRTRTDDSVVRVVRAGGEPQPLMLRRSRGYVPAAVRLPVGAPRPLLACGAELKNTFCVARGDRAWIGPHVGDLRNYESLLSFREGVRHLEQLFDVVPEIVVHDLHPEYLSTKYALERSDLEPLGVQHHHAHLAACLAEHGEIGPALGAIYDGTGYGTDGTVWGGEILWGDLHTFVRAALLWPVRMPGGEAAIREPWRMACAWLAETTGGNPPLPERLAGQVDPERWEAVSRLLRSGVASPLTSSMGRLFDAVSALCGVRTTVTYEGQAAIELETVADPRERAAYPLPLVPAVGVEVLDARETITAAQRDLRNGVAVPTVAARFHNSVAEGTARACRVEAERRATSTVVLSGGVFQNVLLLERTAAALAAAGLRPLIPRRVPPNDGGISYGQAAVAAAMDRSA